MLQVQYRNIGVCTEVGEHEARWHGPSANGLCERQVQAATVRARRRYQGEDPTTSWFSTHAGRENKRGWSFRRTTTAAITIVTTAITANATAAVAATAGTAAAAAATAVAIAVIAIAVITVIIMLVCHIWVH